MKTTTNRPGGLALAASVVMFACAGAAHPVIAKAADGPIPCDAFSRNTAGSWRVLAPVTLEVGGTLYSPMVGTTFPAGASENGIEMSDVLDQQCGNR